MTITDEQKAALDQHTKKWINNAFNTDAMTEKEVEDSKAAVLDMYQLADLPPPEKGLVFVPSLFVGGVVYALAHYALEHGRAPVSKTLKNKPEHIEMARKALFELVGEVPDEGDADECKALVGRSKEAYNGGKDWSASPCHLSAAFDVFDLDIPEKRNWQPYEALAKVGGRYMHAKFAILCDRQSAINRDERNMPHCADGPAVAWRCGTEVYYWHGIKVDKRLIMDPESFTRDEILSERNSEVQRALAERLGWDKFLEVVGGEVVDSATIQGLEYELLELPGEEMPRLLKMRSPELVDGERPWYCERVDRELETAAAARKWQYQLSTDESAKYYRHGDVLICYADPSTMYWPTAEECNEDSELVFEKQT